MINWLHLTDWHVGQSAQGHLWPNLRFEFERDLRALTERYGGIDLVLFTGDLVQSGERKQFHELTQNLKRMWTFFASINCSPKLVAIPGNHDLRRPNPTKGAALALAGWHEQPEVAEVFWKGTTSDLRKIIEKSFEEFDRWSADPGVPMLPLTKGLLPGDIAGTFEKDGLRVGIVGLNSTFLQLRPGNYEGRLALSARQFGEMCGDDYVAWLEQHHFSVLLTHHPETWLSSGSQEEFRRDLAPPGRFRLHLSGHLHAASTTVEPIAGAPSSLRHQGASLFGLEYYGDESKTVRRHGFLFGQWEVEECRVNERLWPRTAVEKEGGALGFVANPSSYLAEDSALHTTFQIASVTGATAEKSAETVPPPKVDSINRADTPSLIGVPLDAAEVTRKLKRVLRFSQSLQPQHSSVRTDERRRLADSLRENRYGWVVADWGMGKDGFLASVIRSDLVSEDEDTRFDDRVFQLQCDTFEQVTELDQAVSTAVWSAAFGISTVRYLCWRFVSDFRRRSSFVDRARPSRPSDSIDRATSRPSSDIVGHRGES